MRSFSWLKSAFFGMIRIPDINYSIQGECIVKIQDLKASVRSFLFPQKLLLIEKYKKLESENSFLLTEKTTPFNVITFEKSLEIEALSMSFVSYYKSIFCLPPKVKMIIS